MAGFRVTLAFPKLSLGRFARSTTPSPLTRQQHFEHENQRLEARLEVLREDMERLQGGGPNPARRLRLKHLELARELLDRQVEVADRICRLKRPLSKVRREWAADPDRVENLGELPELQQAPGSLIGLLNALSTFEKLRGKMPQVEDLSRRRRLAQ